MKIVVLTETNEHNNKFSHWSYFSAKSSYLTENTVFFDRCPKRSHYVLFLLSNY